MQIEIVVYSFSGHTHKVEKFLEQRLTAAGHQTKLM
jgi:flavodoxin